jgi:hypothetical protein
LQGVDNFAILRLIAFFPLPFLFAALPLHNSALQSHSMERVCHLFRPGVIVIALLGLDKALGLVRTQLATATPLLPVVAAFGRRLSFS